MKKQHHLHRQAALHLHEAVIGELVRKQIRQMSLYKEHIVMLEIAESFEVEVDENGHHFRIAHETFLWRCLRPSGALREFSLSQRHILCKNHR